MPTITHRTATILALEASDLDGSPARDSEPLSKLFEDRRETLSRLIDEHGGIPVSDRDTQLIVEFPNAGEAARCAVDIQQAMLAANKRLGLEQRLLFRIGLHVGDLREDKGDLYGDAIDTATGLEELAVPGGICLSGAVHEQVKHTANIGIEYSGEKAVGRNARPVAIYQVVEPGVEKGYISIWAELQRRNVFRVSVAYTVVSWLLIQVADVILPIFNTPAWVLRVLISGLVLGFPVAVVVAWLYELTPGGLKRSDDVLRQASISWLTGRRLDGAIIGMLVVAVVFLVYENYVSEGIRSLDELEPVSVAVLAFENRSADPEDEYFADGLADELLSSLSRIQELKVASRSASFSFKDKGMDVGSIASTLAVDNVLSGSVRRYGDQIRVTAALDDTNNENLLWSETYDRKLDAILDIQSSIAQSVTNAIVPVLSPESQTRIASQPTENTEAYRFYLRGRDYLRQPAELTTLSSARQLFERAISLDSRFAQAYAGLCETHLGAYAFARDPASYEQAELACNRALTLDQGLWEVHLSLGKLYRTNGRYEDAILELETASRQQPNSVEAYLELARTYFKLNKHDLAEDNFRRAQKVESGYWGVHRAYGNFLYELSRFEEAIAEHTKVIELVPDSGVGYDNLGNTYLAMGELDEAEKVFNASPLPSRWTFMNRGLVYYYRGEFEKSAEDQQRAINLAPDLHWTTGFLADSYRFIDGQEEKARAIYEKAIVLAEQELTVNPNDWGTVGRLGLYYAHTGDMARAKSQLDKLIALTKDPTGLYYASLISLEIGDLEGANQFLDRTIEGGWSQGLLLGDPDLVALRDQPAYQKLLKEPTALPNS